MAFWKPARRNPGIPLPGSSTIRQQPCGKRLPHDKGKTESIRHFPAGWGRPSIYKDSGLHFHLPKTVTGYFKNHVGCFGGKTLPNHIEPYSSLGTLQSGLSPFFVGWKRVVNSYVYSTFNTKLEQFVANERTNLLKVIQKKDILVDNCSFFRKKSFHNNAI